jgi:uncharacterized protein YndB with AHSA1/START domain
LALTFELAHFVVREGEEEALLAERRRPMSEDVTFARVIDAPRETVFDAFTAQDGQKAFYSEPGWIVDRVRPTRRRGLDRDVRPRATSSTATTTSSR